jgi:hypothetical protein
MFAGAPPLAGRKSPPNSHKSAAQTSPALPINISQNTQPNRTNLHSFESHAPCLQSGKKPIQIGRSNSEKIGCKSGGEAHFWMGGDEAGRPIQLEGGSNPWHGMRGAHDRWMGSDRAAEIQCGARGVAIRGEAVSANQSAALASPRHREASHYITTDSSAPTSSPTHRRAAAPTSALSLSLSQLRRGSPALRSFG